VVVVEEEEGRFLDCMHLAAELVLLAVVAVVRNWEEDPWLPPPRRRRRRRLFCPIIRVPKHSLVLGFHQLQVVLLLLLLQGQTKVVWMTPQEWQDCRNLTLPPTRRIDSNNTVYQLFAVIM
jgi:hypothetical protein